jgi:hypothetical protein
MPNKIVRNPYQFVNWQTDNQYKINTHCHTMTNKILTEPWTYDLLEYPAGTVFYRNGMIQMPDGTYEDTYLEGAYPWNNPSSTDIYQNCPGDIYGSDGLLYVKERLEKYAALGFDAVCLADHGSATWEPTYGSQVNNPWTKWGFSAAAAGMLEIRGKELSLGPHRVSLFNDYVLNLNDVDHDLKVVGDKGGILHFAHPGRYYSKDGYETWTEEFYASLYQRYENLYGLEIINADDTYEKDRILWDNILSLTMPERNVFSVGVDDAHSQTAEGIGFIMVLSPELRTGLIRRGMVTGGMYTIHMPSGNSELSHIPTIMAPTINAITVEESAGTITIEANNYTEISWYSGVEELGGEAVSRKIATGSVFDYGAAEPLPYIRAELTGVYGTAFTQAWGFVEVTPASVGNAAAADVRIGKTFSNTVGTGFTGVLKHTSRGGGKFPAVYP